MTGRLVHRSELGPERRQDMLALMRMHFHGVTPDQFHADLEEKNWAILLEDRDGGLRGFTTLHVYASKVHPVRVVYSGDTIVDRRARGSTALSRAWIDAVRRLEADVWLLITSGFRTYRFLPVFWRSFWPRYDAPDAPPLLEALARERFGDRYAGGIVRFERPQKLRGDLAVIPAGRMSDPHVAFFAARNPDWPHGAELACLCDLKASNLTRAGHRMVHPGEAVPV